MVKDKLQDFLRENGLLILLSIVFIISRVAVPIKFDGSYIDEYWHIISGISLVESGTHTAFYNNVDRYDRGLLISLWAGFWMALFGKTLIVAKIAPITIAIFNYFLFLYLSLKLFDKKRFQLLLVLLYILSPWILFNHSYIRFYIVNEMFLLMLLVLGYQLYSAMRDDRWKKIGLYLLFIGVLNAVNLVTTNDASKFMLLISSAMMLASLFIYEFNTQPKIDQGLFRAIAGNVCLSNKVYRALIVVAVAASGFVALDAGTKLEFLLNGELAYTSLAGYKYSWLLWEKNGVITAFFVLAVATFWWKNDGYERIILPIAGSLFLIHIASSEDLQIVRGIVYFLPLYYLAAVQGVSKVNDVLKLEGLPAWLLYGVISGVFLISTVTNVEKGFIYGPWIKYEVNYIEYARVYDSVNKNCNDSLIVEAAPSSPFTAKFHGVDIDYILSTADNVEQYGLFEKDENTEGYKTVWGGVPVITGLDDSKLSGKNVCLIVRRPSMKVYLPVSEEAKLSNAAKSWHYHNMDLYLFK